MKIIKVGIIADDAIMKNVYLPVDELKKKGITVYKANSGQSLIKFIIQMDVVHFIYPFDFYKYIPLSKLLGKKVVVHWIGTDVLVASNRCKYKIITKLVKPICDKHLSDAEHLVKELKSLGISAVHLPLIPHILVYSVTPFPDEFTVLSYLPDHRHEFYGSNIIYRLAEELPNINFLVVGGTKEKQKSLPNIEYLGWLDDMDSVYKRSTVLVRMTQHDGTSRMVLEALSYGRPVIRSNEFPFCFYAKNYEEAKQYLLQIINYPKLNISGAKHVVSEFDAVKISYKLTEVYKYLVRK